MLRPFRQGIRCVRKQHYILRVSIVPLSREAAPERSPRVERSGTLGPKPIEGEAPQGARENKPVIPTTIGLRRMKDINLNNRSQPPNL